MAGILVCKLCSQSVVAPQYPLERTRKRSEPILGILGDKPHPDDYKTLRAFTDPFGKFVTDNRILRAELSRAGMFFGDFFATNVWGHEPVEDDAELNWHLKQALAALKGCTLILALGSGATQALLGCNAGDVAGVWSKSSLFPKAKIMPAPHPRGLLRGTVGEFRLALERFKKETKK